MVIYKQKPRTPDAKQVQQYAIWLLARRAYSAHELLEKFRTKYLPAEELFATVLTQLQTEGIQSDAVFTESFVRTHSEWGVRRIQLELNKRGISPELILANLPSEATEEEHCRAVLQKKLKSSALPEEYKAKQKLIAFLARRGFSLDVIQRVFNKQS